jgi:hypothetical protein
MKSFNAKFSKMICAAVVIFGSSHVAFSMDPAGQTIPIHPHPRQEPASTAESEYTDQLLRLKLHNEMLYSKALSMTQDLIKLNAIRGFESLDLNVFVDNVISELSTALRAKLSTCMEIRLNLIRLFMNCLRAELRSYADERSLITREEIVCATIYFKKVLAGPTPIWVEETSDATFTQNTIKQLQYLTSCCLIAIRLNDDTPFVEMIRRSGLGDMIYYTQNPVVFSQHVYEAKSTVFDLLGRTYNISLEEFADVAQRLSHH